MFKSQTWLYQIYMVQNLHGLKSNWKNKNGWTEPDLIYIIIPTDNLIGEQKMSPPRQGSRDSSSILVPKYLLRKIPNETP